MKLVKIKLINWHIFTNSTISMDGNTLITGENASGKSTLMDAIYYVLSGGDDKHFNKAANELGKRDLESYLRGKLGSENQMYLRSGTDVIGYVILEFSNNKTSLVLGVELEIIASVMKKPNFFVINNYSICDEDFVKNKQVVEYRNLKIAFKNSKYSLDPLPEIKKDRKRIIGRDIFKLDNYQRFFELLQHAISFKPIPEVSSFVNSFLLDEDNINLDSLKAEIRSYQNIHKMLVKEKEKIEVLKPFTLKAEKYLKNIESMNYLNALKISVRIEKLKNQINRNNINIERLKSDYKTLKNEEQLYRKDQERYSLELYQLKNNEDYKALLEKKNKLKELESNLVELKKEIKTFESLVSLEQKLSKKLNFKYRFDDDVKNKDFGLLKAHLENYKNELDQKYHDLLHDIVKLENDKDSNNEKLKDLEEQLNNLKKGINNYPSDVYNLISIVKDAIKSSFPKEKNPVVLPFCEYIEINDEKWTNALEGYLNTQRFNLIVEPKYYDVASVAYNKYRNARNVYIAGIVNVSSIPSTTQVKGSMMSKITVSNKYARKYAEYLLNQLVCVDDVSDLKKYDSSITKEVMIYKNHVLKACKPQIYETPYIGKNSREKRIALLENSINDIKNTNKNIIDAINKNKDLENDILSSNIKDILRYDNSWSKIKLYETSILSLKDEIAGNEKEKGLLKISERIKLIETKQQDILNKLNINSEKQQDNLTKQGQLNSQIESIKLELDSNNNELNRRLLDLDSTKYNDIYLNYSNNKSLDEDTILKDLLSCQAYNNSVQNDLLITMQKYSSNYKGSLVPTIDNLEDFVNEYYKLLNWDVIKYEQQAKEAYERAELSFREDFLSKLKEKIENSQRMLDKLNKNLKTHPFGNDEEIYKFYYEPTKNSEFYNYYRIIMSGKLMESKDLFTEILDEKDASFIRDLFDKISMETDSVEAEKELQRYLDYRNYMNYDIKITNKYGDESYFSKINKEKSGGETQTPFYIVMASCFDELMSKDSRVESTCQVVFDEAFNNMDESRIKSLMEFYKNLNIQVIIVVPSNRIAPISPYMDTLVGITKINNHPYVTEIGK